MNEEKYSSRNFTSSRTLAPTFIVISKTRLRHRTSVTSVHKVVESPSSSGWIRRKIEKKHPVRFNVPKV
jgi:hypothetical protein